MRHFYFKFMQGNKGLIKWKKNNNGCNVIPLSVYYGKWKVDDWNGFKDNPDNFFKQYNLKSLAKDQIKTFMGLGQKKDEIYYFWIFDTECIYLFKPIENIVIDGPDDYKEEGGDDPPKSINCELVSKFKKIKLPEVFANINANQKYNRKTIVELQEIEKDIAEHLILRPSEKMKVDRDKIFDCLSPLQFCNPPLK